jgi:transposase-like protein
LRQLRPDIAAAYPKMGLLELEEIAGMLERGEPFKAPAQKRKFHPLRKSTLSREEIEALRQQGLPLRAIARRAGVSAEAVRSLLKNFRN